MIKVKDNGLYQKIDTIDCRQGINKKVHEQGKNNQELETTTKTKNREEIH